MTSFELKIGSLWSSPCPASGGGLPYINCCDWSVPSLQPGTLNSPEMKTAGIILLLATTCLAAPERPYVTGYYSDRDDDYGRSNSFQYNVLSTSNDSGPAISFNHC